jgi:hypothetical protein
MAANRRRGGESVKRGGQSSGEIDPGEVTDNVPPGVLNLQSFMTTVGYGAVVELLRLSPEQDVNGTPIRGFLDNVDVGTSLKAIRDRFGGGCYRLLARASDGTGRIVASCDIEVAGSPVPLVTTARATPAQHEPAASSFLPVPAGRGVAFDADRSVVPVGESMGDFMKWIIQWKIAETMSGSGTKQFMSMLNTVLPLVVREPSGNALAQIEPVMRLLDKVEERIAERGGGDDGGGGLSDMLMKLLPMILSGKSPALLPVGGNARKNPAISPAVRSDVGADATRGEELNALDDVQILNVGVAQVVNGFRLDIPPERVIAVLKTMIALKREALAALKPKRQVMLDYALMNMVDDFQDAPELRKKFVDYFAKVFDGFTDLS